MHGILALVAVPLLFNQIIVVSSNSTVPVLNPIVISANYEQLYSNMTNNTNEYVFLYDSLTEAARIRVSSNATVDLPLILVVRQRRGILSWQIPLQVQSAQGPLNYSQTSRTLCSTKYYRFTPGDEEEFVSISISTASHNNVSFDLMVSIVTDFFIRSDGVPITKEIAPAKPIYFGYDFRQEMDTSSVIVELDSDNDVCMTVSIQNPTCPVFDLERNIEFSGYWQTVSRQGGITVPREAYPTGFFIVLVVKADDTDCDASSSSSLLRNKKITLSIHKSIAKKDWIVASISSLAVIMGFCLFYIIGMIIYKIKERRRLGMLVLSDQDFKANASIQSPSVTEEFQAGSSQFVDNVQEDSSLDEDDIDLLEDAENDKDIVRTKLILSVCDLARKQPKILRHKSRLYLYYLITVAIFYTLPVVQLVVTYQHMLHITGNQDMCYYNFLCAHPFGSVSDFNHVFSNFGYIALGMLFVFITYTRERNETDAAMNLCYGIPQHFGLFYAMGFALMMEGVLSASYHVCPNRSNFQFDSSFMYIIAVLCMIKIYQTRHPDINARAPATFGILAIIILLGLMGVLNGSVYFWVSFSIIHLIACLLLTGQIYYVGRWKFNRGLLIRIVQKLKYDARVGILHLLKPLYWRRFVLLALGNLCNIGLIIWGNIDHRQNFATYLLAILMSNLILYTFFYIIMKLCHGERLLPQPVLYLVLSMVFWGLALYFFVNKTISWALTPAQSRMYNKPCELLRFFDSHDIWHFLSAFAMFFSFMVLFTMDDDLVEVHRSQIQVF